MMKFHTRRRENGKDNGLEGFLLLPSPRSLWVKVRRRVGKSNYRITLNTGKYLETQYCFSFSPLPDETPTNNSQLGKIINIIETKSMTFKRFYLFYF